MAEQTKNVVTGVVVGAALGFVAGILLAPKSGKETREDIRAGVKKAYGFTADKLRLAYDDLAEFVEKIETQVIRAKNNVKKEAQEALEAARRSREQTAAVLAAVRNGESTDEDLDTAVKNANEALANLKKYYNK